MQHKIKTRSGSERVFYFDSTLLSMPQFKYLSTLLLLLVSGFISAQTDTISRITEDEKLVEFFSQHQLQIDTTVNLQLYKVSYDWMGTHYRYSGNTNKGIDCSGFAKIIYREAFHDTLSGGSADMAKRVNLLPKENLQTGDLVFFKIKKKRVSHVGVYLGNNKFVHAAIKGGVQINDLDEPYYKRHFYRGGRLPLSDKE